MRTIEEVYRLIKPPMSLKTFRERFEVVDPERLMEVKERG